MQLLMLIGSALVFVSAVVFMLHLRIKEKKPFTDLYMILCMATCVMSLFMISRLLGII